MRIFCDTASLAEIEEWADHPWISGFTTNPTLMKAAHLEFDGAMQWAKEAVRLSGGKCISIDGPESVWHLGPNVYRKVVRVDQPVRPKLPPDGWNARYNLTAVCTAERLKNLYFEPFDIISVFAGRIMDTGRDPQPVIDAAKATGAQVLWASVRESYNLIQAERAGCDIVTVPPAILQKYLDWHGKPLEVVAEETIAQFARDAEGLQWQ